VQKNVAQLLIVAQKLPVTKDMNAAAALGSEAVLRNRNKRLKD
jgi:hypothetical protein